MLHSFNPYALGRQMDKLLAANYREGVEAREQPLYTIGDAAYYLGLKSQTLHTWLYGRDYPTKKEGKKHWERVIVPADEELKLLSFYNLAEAHVLAATRYEHRVPFWAVRSAMENVIEQHPSVKHPLLADDFFTNGKLMFVKRINELVNISSQQLSLAIMDSFIRHVVSDKTGPVKIYPLRPLEPDDRVISIIAGVCYSRPVIDERVIPVLSVWRRWKAGEDPKFIAEDFEIEEPKIKRAIDYVERRAA